MNVDYLRDLAMRPYRIEPDAQQLNPVEPVFQIIDGLTVIEDGTQRLELHEFDSSNHTDEHVLTFVPSLKLGFLGDLLYSGVDEPVRPASQRTRAVHDLVVALGLDIQQFSQI
jgi:hypothetical protein